MQTIYYTTSNFIRHSGNIIDFTEYRRRMERAARSRAEAETAAASRQEREPAKKWSRRLPAGMERGLLLDCCASAAVLVMTVVAVVQFLTV